MSFLHMSVAGAAMILAITVIRALAINRAPKKTFLALWGAALLRLLIPFSLPSRLSVYALLARKTAAVMPDVPAAALKADPAMQTLSVSPQPGKVNGAAISVWGVVWAVGLLACAAAFAVAYWKCYREFQTSLPVDNAVCRRWLQAHSLRRAMTIRQSDRIWLDNERVQLQSMLGEKGWTSGRSDFIWTQEMIDETISLYEGILADIKNGALYSKSMDGQDDVLVSYNPADVAASTDTGKQ